MVYPNLAAEMARSGCTKEDIAEVLGIHVSGVYLMLEGKRTLSIRRAMKVRDALFPGLKVDYLFDPEEAEEREEE